MLPLRQIAGGLWTFLGFMIVAALVLNMRYKPVGDGARYLDTWTGKIHAAVAEDAPAAGDRAANQRAEEVEVIEGIVERSRSHTIAHGGVSFAFPAPERRIVVIRRQAPQRIIVR